MAMRFDNLRPHATESRFRTGCAQLMRLSLWVWATAPVGELALGSWAWADAQAPSQPAAQQVQSAQSGADARSALLQRAASAVVRLQMLDRTGAEVGHGTGFFIRPDGVLVTARHVSEGARQLVAVTVEGQWLPVTGFLGDDCDFDVAVLKVEGTNLPCLSLADTVRTNEWVGVVVTQAASEGSHATGRVAQVLEFGDVLQHIVTTAPVQRGHSGAPLLNAAGQLVGVVLGASAEGTSFVAPAHSIREILAAPGATNAIPFSKRPRRASRLPVIKDPDFRAGAQAWERNDWPKASQCFSRLVRRYPDSPTAHLLLGISYRGLESWAPAKRALARAVQLKPHSSAAWLLYGSTLLALDQHADAADALREALRLGLFQWHQAVAAWAELARACAALGNVAQTLQALERLAGLDRRRATQLRADLQARYPNLDWTAPAR